MSLLSEPPHAAVHAQAPDDGPHDAFPHGPADGSDAPGTQAADPALVADLRSQLSELLDCLI